MKKYLLTLLLIYGHTMIVFSNSTTIIPADKNMHLFQCITLHQSSEAKNALFNDPTISDERIAIYITRLFARHQIIVAIKDNLVVGMTAFNTPIPLEAHIETLFVKDDYRKQGIGSQLLNYTLSCLEDSSVKLSTDKIHNANALALYQKHGFKEKQCFGTICILGKPSASKQLK
ncbi:TPA: hypothetical protein DCW54_02400 [Candidatus Dependentiae bacterium]|nr:hypothetical protein [Candidatus Dependentiae bacterium]